MAKGAEGEACPFNEAFIALATLRLSTHALAHTADICHPFQSGIPYKTAGQ